MAKLWHQNSDFIVLLHLPILRSGIFDVNSAIFVPKRYFDAASPLTAEVSHQTIRLLKAPLFGLISRVGW
jgi:hypothetical protein